MAKHARVLTDDQRERLERNRSVMMSVISGEQERVTSPDAASAAGLMLTLERIAIRRDTQQTVPYEGPSGVERLLSLLTQAYPDGTRIIDRHLVSIGATLLIEGHEQPVALRAEVGAGAQVRLTVGPAASIAALLDAIRVFDRQVHLASKELGHDIELVAQGYNPTVASPSDVVQVPLSRYVLMNAYLSRTGRYARDAMRCIAGTTLSLPIATSEEEAVDTYQICAALSPILAFLTDNTLTLRGSDPRLAPRMVRTLVLDQLDAARCGPVPGTFADSFSFASYEQWIEQIRPILFTSDEGVTFSTGTDTIARIMEERDLSTTEAHRLLQTALPLARWTGRLELLAADALPLRLAAGYAALVKGLLSSAQTRAAVRNLILQDADDDAYEHAWRELRELGWQARPYGRPITQIAGELARFASAALGVDERRLLDELAQLWEVRFVPRDTLLRNWEQSHHKTKEEEAIELYGEGAVIPYDELDDDPPAGRTSELPVIRG